MNHCAAGAMFCGLLGFLAHFSEFWGPEYTLIGNLERILRFVQGTNTLVVPCGVSAAGDMSPLSPVDIAPMIHTFGSLLGCKARTPPSLQAPHCLLHDAMIKTLPKRLAKGIA